MSTLQQAVSKRSSKQRVEEPDPTVQPPSCPNCSRRMVLSHKFYAQRGGPQMWHFHCITCKVGYTVAEEGGSRKQ
jgi:hypothetical protein